MNIAIYGRKITKQNVTYFKDILDKIQAFGWTAILEKDLREQLVKKAGIGQSAKTFENFRDFTSGIDLALSVGGDGTFLQTVKFIRNSTDCGCKHGEIRIFIKCKF